MNARWRPPSNATTYPRRQGDWTIAHNSGMFSAFSPEAQTTLAADPKKDPKLPGLGPALKRGELVSYRIGRRAVVATTTSYIKVVRPERLAALEHTHRLAMTLLPEVPVPPIISTDPQGSIELAAMPGVSLHDTIAQHALSKDTVGAIARSLAKLHSITNLASLPHRQADPPQQWLDIVARVDSEAADQLALIASRLPPISTGTASVIHSDLHDKNIFTTTTHAGFIDLDGLAHGAAEQDLANLAVHLKLRALQNGRDPKQAATQAAVLYDRYRAERFFCCDVAKEVEQHTWFRLGCLYLLRYRSDDLAAQIFNQSGLGLSERAR